MYVYFFQENYKVPRLRKGALPSVFPDCPKYLSKVPKARKSPEKRQIPPRAEKGKRRKVPRKVVETLDIPAVVSKESFSFDVPDMPEISDALFKNTENVSEIERIALFESMFVCKDLFKLPTAWTRCDCTCISDGHSNKNAGKWLSISIRILFKGIGKHG